MLLLFQYAIPDSEILKGITTGDCGRKWDLMALITTIRFENVVPKKKTCWIDLPW
jgi:hypothetical protein